MVLSNFIDERSLMVYKTSMDMRKDPLFMRNDYVPCGQWGMPYIRKQMICLEDVSLIACSDTKYNDNKENKKRGVHFFVDDYRFEGIYRNPGRSLPKYAQYAFLLTPDYSLYADMNPWRQLESVAHSRWCGAYWQSKGLLVIPTVSWSTHSSYSYCFDGIERGSIVAIGMVGCKRNKSAFMKGYAEMLDKISPEAIICFGSPFDEMGGHIIEVDYQKSRRVVR